MRWRLPAAERNPADMGPQDESPRAEFPDLKKTVFRDSGLLWIYYLVPPFTCVYFTPGSGPPALRNP